jgi:hypothetical protein
MSTVEVLQRRGLGPGIDPHLDAAAGRKATGRDLTSTGASSSASGYVELHGERPFDDLRAVLTSIFQRAARVDELSARDRQSVDDPWATVKTIRYLTTDPGCGVAMPMHDLMPGAARGHGGASPAESLRIALRELDELADHKLGLARSIGLNVEFDLQAIVPRIRIAADGEGPRTPVMDADRSDRQMPGAHRMGLAGHCDPQLATAMRQFGGMATGRHPLDYGIAQRGRNTIVGIVDFGCDFAHSSFRTGALQERSRILALWDQNDGPGQPPVVSIDGQGLGFGFGRLFTRVDIEAALAGATPGSAFDPYAALGYDPHAQHYTAMRPGQVGGPGGAHGTAVMEIAAGGVRSVGGEPFPPRGVAPDADIVFVQLRLPTHRGRRDLDLNDVLEAVGFVFRVAEREQRPCVVNLSLNSMSGPHDGDSYFDWRLRCLLRSAGAGPRARGRAVVIASGNLPAKSAEAMQWQHISGTVVPGASTVFHWIVGPQDPSRNNIEIWYDGGAVGLQVTLVSHVGERLGPITPGQAAELMIGEGCCGNIIGSRSIPAFDAVLATELNRQVILIQLEAEVSETQIWQVVVDIVPDPAGAPPGNASVTFDAWLERDDACPSGLCRHSPPRVVDPLDRDCTIGTLSCSQEAIVVGAYSTLVSPVELWGLSGHGPDRRGVLKPDLAAPGHQLSLVRSCPGDPQDPLFFMSGTSLAAPFVTGTIACIYEVDPRASLAQIRSALTGTAAPLPGTTAGWTPELGHGLLDPAAVLGRFAA